MENILINFIVFQGLPPKKAVTRQQQLEEFSKRLSQQFNLPDIQYQNWSDALWAVGERLKKGKVLLLFDEISWMGSKDPAFLGKLKMYGICI